MGVNIGDKFGRLTVLSIRKNGQRKFCTCKCECGIVKEVRSDSLVGGKTTSCGCFNREIVSSIFSRGGFSNTRLYQTWENMKARCLNPNHPRFKDYGARGISVCEDWIEDFSAFRNWAISNGWNEYHEKNEISLDRIDVNGDYTPENCRWADYNTQQNNKTVSVRWDYKGTKYTLVELSETFNINIMALRSRLYTQKMTVEEAVEKPLRKRTKKIKK